MATNKTTKTTKTTTNKTAKTTKTTKTDKSKCTCNHSHDRDLAAELDSVRKVLDQVFGKARSQDESESETARKKSISDLKIVTSQDQALGSDKSLVAFLLGGITTCIDNASDPYVSEERTSIDIVSIMAAIHDIYLHGVRDGYLRNQVKSFKALLSTDSAKILFKELADDSDTVCEDVADFNKEIDEKSAKSLIELLAFVHPIVKDRHLKDNLSEDNDSEKSNKSEEVEEVEDNDAEDNDDDSSVTMYHVKLTDAGSGNVVEVEASSQDELIDKIKKLKENGDIPEVVADKVISDVIRDDDGDTDDKTDDNTGDKTDDKSTESTKSKKFTKPTKTSKASKECRKDSDTELPPELLDTLMKLFSDKD